MESAIVILAVGGLLILIFVSERIVSMSAALDRLTNEVRESRDATDAATALIAGLAAEIRENIGNDAALEALADDLDAQQGDMSAAITENTPAAEEPAPEPEPVEEPVE